MYEYKWWLILVHAYIGQATQILARARGAVKLRFYHTQFVGSFKKLDSPQNYVI